MNDALRLLTSLVLAGAVWIALQPLAFYPCRLTEWRYAFGAEFRSMRTRLREGARELGAVQRKEREIRARSRKQNADIDTRAKETIRGYEQKRDTLLDPGPGERLAAEGRLELYERRLVFLKEEPDGESPAVEVSMTLAGLTITQRRSSGRIRLTARSQKGDILSAFFPETSEVEARHLYDRICSAVNKEEAVSEERENEASRLASEMRCAEKEARARTAAVNNAQAEQIAALQPDRKAAEDAFDAQCTDWEDETGRRPHPRWCRWSAWWWRW